MSDNTKVKKLARDRMARTGEPYSTARMHVLSHASSTPTAGGDGQSPGSAAAVVEFQPVGTEAPHGGVWASDGPSLDRIAPPVPHLIHSRAEILEPKAALARWNAAFLPRATAEEKAERLRAWASREGVTRSKGHCCLRRVATGRCGIGDCPHLPGSDHTSVWIKEGRPHIYVTQPYHVSDATLTQMIRTCRQWGLMLRIDSAPAWHNEYALLIEVLREDQA